MKIKNFTFTFALASTIAIFASPVFANDFSVVKGKVIGSEPIVNTVQTPVTVQECRYERRQSSNGANALGGMIIGGLIGKGATGNDTGAAAGAVLGGIIGADQGTNNRLVQVCDNVTSYENHTTIVGYETKIEWNGVQVLEITDRRYNKGDSIRLRVYLELH